jgi:predicted RNA binding protein YcfA (HicA-like mRNA interferase family)
VRRWLVDSGPLIALFDRDDAHHERIKASLENHPARLLTTWPVLTETCALLPAPNTQDFLTFATRGSHRQFKHPSKPGRVTVPGKPNDDLAPGTLNSILKQAGLKT